jgi:virginiamycin B lyase
MARALARGEEGQSLIQAIATAVIITVLGVGAYYAVSALFDANGSSQQVVAANDAIDHARGVLSSYVGEASQGDLGLACSATSPCGSQKSGIASVSLAGDQLFIDFSDGPHAGHCVRLFYRASNGGSGAPEGLDYAQGSTTAQCTPGGSGSIAPVEGPSSSDASSDPALSGGVPVSSLVPNVLNGQEGEPSMPVFSYLDAQGQPLGEWSVNAAANSIDHILSDGQVQSYPLLTPNADPQGLAWGADGLLWFTEYGVDQVGSLDTSNGTIKEYALPAGSAPAGIASSGGRMWVALSGTSYVVSFDPTEVDGSSGLTKLEEASSWSAYQATTSGSDISSPYALAAGPDGEVWMTEHDGYVAAITSDGTITQSATSSGGIVPEGITQGPDGKMWFTTTSPSGVGQVAAEASALPSYSAASSAYLSAPPTGIASSGGRVWVGAGDDLAALSPSAPTSPVLTSFPSSLCASVISSYGPQSLAAGANGDLVMLACDGGDYVGYDTSADSFSSPYGATDSGGTGSPLPGITGIVGGGPDSQASASSDNGWYESSSDVDAIGAVQVTLYVAASGSPAQERSFDIPLCTLPGAGSCPAGGPGTGSSPSSGEFTPANPPYYTTGDRPQVTDCSAGATQVSRSDLVAISEGEPCAPITKGEEQAKDKAFGGWDGGADGSGAALEATAPYSFQWQDCKEQGEDCQDLSGQTGSSWTDSGSVPSGDRIRVLVTAHSDGGASEPVPSNELTVGS